MFEKVARLTGLETCDAFHCVDAEIAVVDDVSGTSHTDFGAATSIFCTPIKATPCLFAHGSDWPRHAILA